MLRVCCADVVRTHLGNFPIGFRKFPHVDFAHLCSHLFFAFNVRKCDCRLACVVSQVFVSVANANNEDDAYSGFGDLRSLVGTSESADDTVNEGVSDTESINSAANVVVASSSA